MLASKTASRLVSFGSRSSKCSKAFISTSRELRGEAAPLAVAAGSSLANVIDTSITVSLHCDIG